MSRTFPHLYLRRSCSTTQEPSLIRPLALALAAFGLLLPTGSLRGQASTDAPAFAALEVSAMLTTLRGKAGIFAGAAGLLGWGEGFAVGGAARIQGTDNTIATGSPDSDLQLVTAYGGLLTQLSLPVDAPGDLFVRVLLGAGSAKIRLPVVGTEIAADNFAVIEPEVVLLRGLAGPLRVGAGVGYRLVFGVEDLPGLGAGDLRGPSARIFLHIGTP